MTREEHFMQQAIELSAKAIAGNEGGPFGCVIVKGETIVGRGNNKVTSTNDPTYPLYFSIVQKFLVLLLFLLR